MKIFNFFFVVVFVVFAALQYNDADPFIWIPLYLYAALLCWLAARKNFNQKAYWAGFAVYGAYAIYKIFDTNGLADWITKHHSENLATTMKAETPWIEESREFFGLVIILAVLTVNYVYLTKLRRINR